MSARQLLIAGLLIAGLLIAGLLAAALGVTLPCQTAQAAATTTTLKQTLAQALAHYNAGRYKAAAQHFERAAAAIKHEDIFYNLGCVYYRLGDLGRAIYNFERSLKIAPDRDDAAYNLKIARAAVESSVKDVIAGADAETWWVAAIKLSTPEHFCMMALLAWWLFFALLFIVRRLDSGPLRAGLSAATVFIAIATIALGALFIGATRLERSRDEAIVLTKRLQVREGPMPAARGAFALHAGTRVEIKQRQAQWARLRLSNGLEGWAPLGELGQL